MHYPLYVCHYCTHLIHRNTWFQDRCSCTITTQMLRTALISICDHDMHAYCGVRFNISHIRFIFGHCFSQYYCTFGVALWGSCVPTNLQIIFCWNLCKICLICLKMLLASPKCQHNYIGQIVTKKNEGFGDFFEGWVLTISAWNQSESWMVDRYVTGNPSIERIGCSIIAKHGNGH